MKKKFLKGLATGLAAAALSMVSASVQAEDRILWLSIGDNITNTASLDSNIQYAIDNNFNAVCILARFRANAYYIPNRDFATYTNPEPRASGSVDTVQYVIDRAKDNDLRVYAAWSVYLVTDGSNTLPSFLDNSWRTWVYEDIDVASGTDTTYTPAAGFPRAQTTADSSGGLWLDPGVPAANDYLQDVILDFVENYDVDGLILDRIRFPGDSIPYRAKSFGYNPTALANYGLTDPPPRSTSASTNGESTDSFLEAKRDAVSGFIESTQAEVHALKPWIIFGATPVVFGSSNFSTLNGVYQDYFEWDDRAVAPGIKVSNAGIIDVFMPQYYRTTPATNDSLLDLFEDDGTEEMTNMAHSPIYGAFLADTSGADLASNIAFNRSTTNAEGGTGVEGWGVFSADGLMDIATGETNDRLTELEATNTSLGTNVITNDANGLTEFTNKVGWDSTPPGAAGSFTAVAQSDGSVDLSWSAATDATSYLVFRDTDSTVEPYYENLLDPASTVSGTSFTDSDAISGLQPGQTLTYYYSIIPVDSFNNRGASSTSSAVVISPTTVIVESRQGDISGTQTTAPTFSTSDPFSTTSAKSPNAVLSGTGSLFTTTTGRTASFSPAIAETGLYHVYYIIDGGGSNSNAFANADVTISTNLEASDFTDTITLNAFAAPFSSEEFLQLTSTPLEVSAGAAGSAITLTLENQGGGTSPVNRFIADSAAFVKVGEITGDVTPPTLDSVAVVTSDPTNGNSAAFTFNFSEDVQNFNDFGTDVTASGVTFGGGSIASVNSSTYTVTVTGITSDGTLTVSANTGSDIQDLAANPLAAGPASNDILIDTAPPTVAINAIAPQATGSVSISASNLTDSGSAISTATAWSRANGGSWVSEGSVLTPISGAPSNQGVIDLYASATDAAGNSKPDPTGGTTPDTTLFYSNVENSLTYDIDNVLGADAIFPMTNLNLVKVIPGASSLGGSVTVTRTTGDNAPVGFDSARLIDEFITVNASAFTGNVSVVWYGWADAGNSGSTTEVYKVDSGSVTTIPSGDVTFPGAGEVRIDNITGFSDFYLGDANATEDAWMILED